MEVFKDEKSRRRGICIILLITDLTELEKDELKRIVNKKRFSKISFDASKEFARHYLTSSAIDIVY